MIDKQAVQIRRVTAQHIINQQRYRRKTRTFVALDNSLRDIDRLLEEREQAAKWLKKIANGLAYGTMSRRQAQKLILEVIG